MAAILTCHYRLAQTLLQILGNTSRCFDVVLCGSALTMYAYRLLTIMQLFYRMKKDGPVLLGWRHPWEH